MLHSNLTASWSSNRAAHSLPIVEWGAKLRIRARSAWTYLDLKTALATSEYVVLHNTALPHLYIVHILHFTYSDIHSQRAALAHTIAHYYAEYE